MQKTYLCPNCKRIFLIKNGEYYKKYCQDCRAEYQKQNQKKYQAQYWIKNKSKFWSHLSYILYSKEMLIYRKECCEDIYSKVSEDLYRLLTMFSLIVRPAIRFFTIMCLYDKRYKLYLKKEEQRIKKWQSIKTKRDELKQYCKDNDLHYRKEFINRYYLQRRKIDLKFNLNGRISVAMGHSLKGNKAGRHWEDLVGYTLDDLLKRLKKTMPQGYNWQNYLDGELHIDHIIPISAFNFTKTEHIDFKRCWALGNLRLLLAMKNWKKHAKLDKPFQRALAF
jgi:hypothetical protein